MINPYYGIRFLILEESDLGSTVINEYDCAPVDETAMRHNLQIHIDNLNKGCTDKRYILKEEIINDQTNQV